MKLRLYSLARLLGGFDLARFLSRGQLGILCYHGFSLHDEHQFRPKLFITADHFAARLDWLRRNRYIALPIEEAHQRLTSGRLGARELVLTIDDGFHGVHAIAAPLLEAAGFTATIYVTTYYVQHQNPVFRLAVQYLFWRTARHDADLDGLAPGLGCCTTRGAAAEAAIDRLVAHGETALDEAGRVALATELGRRLAVDYAALQADRRLTLMSEAQIADLAARGFDIQLHTHRHRLPDDDALVAREIEDNRKVLERLSGRPARHLCYPSGLWSTRAWPALRCAGVLTATTCEPDLNPSGRPPLALTRFLDFQDTPDIVFEAEVAGFGQLARRAAGRRQAAAGSPAEGPQAAGAAPT
mgnify:CR=1 FL=1